MYRGHSSEDWLIHSFFAFGVMSIQSGLRRVKRESHSSFASRVWPSATSAYRILAGFSVAVSPIAITTKAVGDLLA